MALGAGEILLTSVDREGTGLGFDLDSIARIARRVSVPVLVSGGAGALDQFDAAAGEAGADGFCLASMLHYKALEENPCLAGDCSRVFRGGFAKVQGATIPEVKAHLRARGIDCRPPDASVTASARHASTGQSA